MHTGIFTSWSGLLALILSSESALTQDFLGFGANVAAVAGGLFLGALAVCFRRRYKALIVICFVLAGVAFLFFSLEVSSSSFPSFFFLPLSLLGGAGCPVPAAEHQRALCVRLFLHRRGESAILRACCRAGLSGWRGCGWVAGFSFGQCAWHSPLSLERVRVLLCLFFVCDLFPIRYLSAFTMNLINTVCPLLFAVLLLLFLKERYRRNEVEEKAPAEDKPLLQNAIQ